MQKSKRLNPFSSDDEMTQARQFKDLATMFEQPDTIRLCERFSLLAILFEQKAKILRELEEAVLYRTREEEVHGQLAAWTALNTKQSSGENQGKVPRLSGR
jgi:hypothetical protein